jgi:hypothetical protein
MTRDYNPVFDKGALLEKITSRSENEIRLLPARRKILRNAVTSFNSLLAKLPERQRDATTSLLYDQVIDTLFDLQRHVESMRARRHGPGSTLEEKRRMLREYRATIDEMARIYEVA